MEEGKVIHDEIGEKFYIRQQGKIAKLKYKRLKNNVLEIKKTKVPEALRGKGIALQLAKAAFNYAKTFHFSIIPSCNFVRKILERSKEFYFLIHKSN